MSFFDERTCARRLLDACNKGVIATLVDGAVSRRIDQRIVWCSGRSFEAAGKGIAGRLLGRVPPR